VLKTIVDIKALCISVNKTVFITGSIPLGHTNVCLLW